MLLEDHCPVARRWRIRCRSKGLMHADITPRLGDLRVHLGTPVELLAGLNQTGEPGARPADSCVNHSKPGIPAGGQRQSTASRDHRGKVIFHALVERAKEASQASVAHPDAAACQSTGCTDLHNTWSTHELTMYAAIIGWESVAVASIQEESV